MIVPVEFVYAIFTSVFKVVNLDGKFSLKFSCNYLNVYLNLRYKFKSHGKWFELSVDQSDKPRGYTLSDENSKTITASSELSIELFMEEYFPNYMKTEYTELKETWYRTEIDVILWEIYGYNKRDAITLDQTTLMKIEAWQKWQKYVKANPNEQKNYAVYKNSFAVKLPYSVSLMNHRPENINCDIWVGKRLRTNHSDDKGLFSSDQSLHDRFNEVGLNKIRFIYRSNNGSSLCQPELWDEAYTGIFIILQSIIQRKSTFIKELAEVLNDDIVTWFYNHYVEIYLAYIKAYIKN